MIREILLGNTEKKPGCKYRKHSLRGRRGAEVNISGNAPAATFNPNGVDAAEVTRETWLANSNTPITCAYDEIRFVVVVIILIIIIIIIIITTTTTINSTNNTITQHT